MKNSLCYAVCIMTEIGAKSSILEEILADSKTIEGRLAKPRFLALRAGDMISLREDAWQDGSIVHSKPGVANIVVTNIEHFTSFGKMLMTLGYEHIVLAAHDYESAVTVYGQFYSTADERQYGVLAISFQLI